MYLRSSIPKYVNIPHENMHCHKQFLFDLPNSDLHTEKGFAETAS